MNIKLPDDIRRKVRKNIIVRLSIFLLLEVLVVVAVFLTWERISDLPRYQIILICTVEFLLPVFISKIYKLVFDSSWCGKIIGVRTRSVPGKLYSTGSGRAYQSWDDVICLTIRKSNGKIIEYNAESFLPQYTSNVLMPSMENYNNKSDISDSIDNYRAGDTVYHFYGLKRLLVCSSDTPDRHICIICGMKHNTKSEKCVLCGHTLMNSQTLLCAGDQY